MGPSRNEKESRETGDVDTSSRDIDVVPAGTAMLRAAGARHCTGCNNNIERENPSVPCYPHPPNDPHDIKANNPSRGRRLFSDDSIASDK